MAGETDKSPVITSHQLLVAALTPLASFSKILKPIFQNQGDLSGRLKQHHTIFA